MKDNTLREILNGFWGNISELQGEAESGERVRGYEFELAYDQATEAIMKLVASKVPKEKEWFVEQPDTHRNYVGGYNACRAKMLDNLGVEE